MNDLQSLLKDLYNISGLNISIFDIDEKLVTSYPTRKSPFCHLIDQNQEAVKHCYQCDHEAFEKVKQTKQLYIYQCHFHLYEAVVPIFTYGCHSGYLMMGQTLTNTSMEKNLIFKEANNYINDPIKLNEAIEQISFHTKDQIISFAKIVDVCGKYITLTNRLEAKSKDLAKEVHQYLINNYSQEITIDSLCDYFYTSRATLINRFKETYGATVHQYLLNYRLSKAKELLHQEEYTISKIAELTGFIDPNYFSKAFKKKYNKSPKDYRECAKVEILS